MGNSAPKARTGIRVLDDTINSSAAIVSGGMLGTNNIQQLSSNIEKNAQGAIKDVAALAHPGGFNNLGNTFLRNTISSMNFGMVNPNDLQKIGETGAERTLREQTAKAEQTSADQLLADEASRTEENLRAVRSTISGVVDSRRRTPGRQQTLLTGGAQSNQNTLLTQAKK